MTYTRSYKSRNPAQKRERFMNTLSTNKEILKLISQERKGSCHEGCGPYKVNTAPISETLSKNFSSTLII